MANQGFHHPTYNPNGSKLASDGKKWYETAVSFTSISDCFTESKLQVASGYIGTTSARPDGLFYDQVHEGSITDLRNSSQKVEDYNRLIDREFNKLVSGTYRGSEGEWRTFTHYGNGALLLYNYGGGRIAVYFTTTTTVGLKIGDTVQLSYYNGTSYYNDRGVVTTILNNFIEFYNCANISAVTTGTLSQDNIKHIIYSVKSTSTKSNTLTHTDIIGSPANYPTAWKQSGVSGTPLIVAEDGTSLLPTGALTAFKLSRKANATPLQVLKSTDGGATWTALAVTTGYTVGVIGNTITFVTAPSTTDLIMVTYQTHTSMAVAGVNSEVLAIGDVYESGAYHTYYGGHLIYTIIGKIAVSDTLPSQVISNGIVKGYMYQSNTRLLHTVGGLEPKSNPVALAALGATARAVKVFPYLTRFNGKAYLNLVFKEMKYGSYVAPTVVTTASATYTQYATYEINVPDSPLHGKVIQRTSTTTTSTVDWALYDVSPTGVIYLVSTGGAAGFSMYDGDSWGDNSKFEIIDNVSTTTDTNGQVVLIGQKKVELNYFIDAKE